MDDEEYYELLDEAEWAAQSEHEVLLQLFEKAGFPANFFNSFDWVNDCKDRIEKPTNLPIIERLAEAYGIIPEFNSEDFETGLRSIGLEQVKYLEESWQKIGKREEYQNPYRPSFRISNPVELFMMETSYGCYPSPEILIMLFKCFALYFEAKGKLTLEDVFFGKSVKRVGNYAARKANSSRYVEFHYQVVRERAVTTVLNKPFSLEKLALEFIEMDCEDAPRIVDVESEKVDSYIRGYHRWLKKIENIDDK